MNRRLAGRCLLLHGGALGDCLLAYHLMRRVVRDPGRDLFIIARHSVHRWLTRHGLIAASAFADDCGVTSLFLERPRLSDHVRDWIADCDWIVNMIDSSGGVVERNLAEATSGHVVSIDPRPDTSKRHIVNQWADRLKCGASQPAMDPNRKAFSQFAPVQLSMPDSPTCPTNTFRATDSSDVVTIIVHPGSGGVGKCASPNWFEAVVAGLIKRNIPTAWMIGPDEEQRDGPTLRRRLEVTAPVILEPDIGIAADRIASAEVFVGNDSGMAHLAALCGLRTIVWFGPTNPAVWRPIGSDVHVIRDTDLDSSVDCVLRLMDTDNQ